LESIASHLRAAEEVSVEEFIQTIEGMNMLDKYYTPEQLERIKERGQQVGEERIRQVQEEWPKLHAEVQAEMAKGSDPASEPVQALARRWMGLVNEFTGGDPGIENSLRKMYEQEDNIVGMDVAAMRPMMAFMDKAIAAAKKAE
jgi:hypothetical protein